MLGLPFNIASYGLLLHLLAAEAGLKEGKLVGFLADTHIYMNHAEGASEQAKREPLPLPHLFTDKPAPFFEWTHEHTSLRDYSHHAKINYPIAV